MNRLTKSFLSVLAGWSVAVAAQAQTAVSIFSFDASGTNGAYPEANLTLGPDGNFYGTAESGGAATNGTIFRVTTNGTFATLVSFNGTNGANPLAALTLGPDGNFYGTTEYGGSTIGNTSVNGAGLGGGTVFQMTTNGTLTTLVNFAATNGASPHGGLIWGSDGNLYGATASGGPYGDGILFRVTTGGAFTILTNFNGADGNGPVAGLTLGPDGNFYGTTENGGSAGYGTVFKWGTNGTLTTLANFNGTNNGVSPQVGLTVGPDGNFYGTTSDSYIFADTLFPGFTINIPWGNGTIFQITTNGALTTLIDFDNYTAGITPNAKLTLGPDGSFYGVTYTGGSYNLGTIYGVTTSGRLTTLVSFDNTNGAYSLAGLTLGPDGNFYGPATAGGAGGNGTVFQFPLPAFSIALADGGAGNFMVSVESYPGSTNQIWTSTNLTSPSAWQVLGTIVTDTNGSGQLLDTDTAGIPAKFYRLTYP